MASQVSCCDKRANYHKLTKVEEDVIIQYILDLDTRGFAPRLGGVEDIANYILELHRGQHVGKN